MNILSQLAAMPLNDQIAVVLAIIAFGSYLTLMVMRLADPVAARTRLVFLDLLLAVAALEVVADTWHLHALALLTQGALLAGGVALLATYRNRHIP